ncbi:hypothetical protein RRG58_08005 [Mycoplasmopsis cynos]|nr:hypothetical protein [Mycoplasmopsis felis]WQQ11609.1 hypothetical protein RRG50_04200 [Mycoplasmopsis felis]
MYFVGEGDGSPGFTAGSGWVDGCSLLLGWETFAAGVSESVGSSGLFVGASFEWMLLLGDSEFKLSVFFILMPVFLSKQVFF